MAAAAVMPPHDAKDGQRPRGVRWAHGVRWRLVAHGTRCLLCGHGGPTRARLWCWACLATAMGFWLIHISACRSPPGLARRPPSPALTALALEGIVCSADDMVEAVKELALEVFVEAEATVERMIQARHV